MKKIVAFVALLFLLVACVPKEPVQPVVEQPPVESAVQEPPVVPADQAPPVVKPAVQTIVQPSKNIEQIDIMPSVSSSVANVDIVDFSFQPAEVKVKVGDTVVWTQRDNVKHNVEIVSGPETFKSELLELGKTFSYTFTKPGAYEYKCTPHPKMRGKVIVE